MPPNETVIRAQGLSKIYPAAKAPVPVFRQLSLEVAQGEILGVVGPSGVGKSTLLNILGGLDTPTEGTVEVLGMELTRLSPAARSAFRKSRIAYVFQFHHLLHELNLVEYVALPLLIRGGRLRSSLIEAREALASVGLSDLGSRYPRELSGGEQHRGCLARALSAQPRLLLLDEPTGSLDQATADGVMNVFRDLHLKNSWTSIIVTHNVHVSRLCTRIFRLGPPA